MIRAVSHGIRFTTKSISSAHFANESRVMASALPSIPASSRLSDLVMRITGGNPSKFTLQGTNTYLVGRGPERILIDCGQGFPIWAENVRKVLHDENAVIRSVLLTHHHHDHTAGLKDVPKTDSNVQAWKHPAEPLKSEYKAMLDEAISHWKGEIQPLEDGKVFPVPGAHGTTLTTIHTPGHTADHCAFLLEHDKQSQDDYPILFTGDAVLGHGTAVFEDLAAYIAGLHRMEGVVAKTPGNVQAFPAHGEVIKDAGAKLKEYIDHRAQREKEVIAVLQKHADGLSNSSPNGMIPMDIVKIIYKDYPESLHLPAEGGVRQVLKKLHNESRVAQDGDRFKLLEQDKISTSTSAKAGL